MISTGPGGCEQSQRSKPRQRQADLAEDWCLSNVVWQVNGRTLPPALPWNWTCVLTKSAGYVTKPSTAPATVPDVSEAQRGSDFFAEDVIRWEQKEVEGRGWSSFEGESGLNGW